MRSLSTLLAGLAIAFATPVISQTIWSGAPITFTKAAFSDHTLAVNQDQVTSGLRITRANTKGIFNIASESAYVDFSSPAGTEWSFGTTANIGSLNFDDWETAVNGDPPAMVNMPMVMHIIAGNIFVDVTFLSWSQGNGGGQPSGGGFSYTRSTSGPASVQESNLLTDLVVMLDPNSNNVLMITGALSSADPIDLSIFDITGAVLKKEQVKPSALVIDHRVELGAQTKGTYLVQIVQGGAVHTKRFVIQ